MKKILFVLLMLLTWYLAAMYHLISLMTLALAEILFFLGMFLASRYLRRHTKVRFSEPAMVITKNQKTPCRIVMEHTGILPPGRLRLRFRLAYWDQKGETTGFFYHHGLGGEQEEAGFYLDAPWCGQLIISMERVQIFDYVSLFQAGLLAGEELEAAVLPGGAAMTIRISEEFGNQQGWEAEIQPFVGMGDGEIRQLRDYFPGDPHRLIHWKQSARMDTLLVKEQGPRQEQSAWLYLDLHSDQPKSARELDAFFEILHSLILGLMEEAFTLLVRWKEPDGSWAGMEAADREDGSALLLRLYQSESMQGGAPALIPPKQGLCLNVDRKLVSGGRQEMRDGSVLDLLCCLAAVYGLLFLLHSVEGMAFRLGASLLIASIPGIVLWYFRRRKNAGLFWGCVCHDRSPGTGFSHPLAAVWPDYFGFASSSVFGDGSRFAAGVSAFGLSNRFLGDQWMAEGKTKSFFFGRGNTGWQKEKGCCGCRFLLCIPDFPACGRMECRAAVSAGLPGRRIGTKDRKADQRQCRPSQRRNGEQGESVSGRNQAIGSSNQPKTHRNHLPQRIYRRILS